MTQTTFKCTKCDQGFGGQRELDDHMRTRHQEMAGGRDDEMRGDTAREGGMGPRHEANVEAHVTEGGSGEMAAGMGAGSDMGANTTGESMTGTFRCEACGSEFRSRPEREDHGRTAHNR